MKKALIKNHTQETGNGIIRNVEYIKVVFTKCNTTTFMDCIFTDCTFQNNKFVSYKNCEIDGNTTILKAIK